VISPDGRWLADLSVGHPRWVSRTHQFVRERIPAACEDLRGTALVLAHPYADRNYFHWLFNCVPRIELYRIADVDLDEVDHVVVSANQGAYRNETLERLGVPLDRLVECHEGFHARAERVLATSNVYYAYVRPWAHDFLRETFLPFEPPASGPERIFVSREPDRGRPLVNGLECLGLLEQRGFVPVRLTGMTVVEQAALFARARCVASPHEAGLSNLVFCRPGTTVIELFSPTLLHAHYAEVSALRGLEYFCLIGEDKPADGRRAYRVPIDALERLLDAAGL
jgi:capsular polysaccharide biosynthesis protein